MRRILLSIALLATQISLVFGQSSIGSEIAPGGKMRVGMIAITVLGGVADPVAKFIGSKLGLPVDIVMYPNPEAYAQSFGKGEWDIAIGPRALAPEEKADSTADLWIISLVYIAAPGQRVRGYFGGRSAGRENRDDHGSSIGPDSHSRNQIDRNRTHPAEPAYYK